MAKASMRCRRVETQIRDRDKDVILLPSHLHRSLRPRSKTWLDGPHCGGGSETPGCNTDKVASQYSALYRRRGRKWSGLGAAQIGTRRSFNAGIYLPAATTSSKPPVTVRLTCKLPAASRRSGPL
ncbi:hypothetical protein MCOR02_004217 [Pyricularia oryzae]|nr:hypothetical protein MCOR02_004217 [Pyricularia oryzae]